MIRLFATRRFAPVTVSRCFNTICVAASTQKAPTLSLRTSPNNNRSFGRFPSTTVHLRWMSDNKQSNAKDPSVEEEDKVHETDDKKVEPEDLDIMDDTYAEDIDKVEESMEPLSLEEQLEAEVKKLKHQLLTSLADQENTRRIAHNDVKAAKQFAIKSFAKSLLDVSDNLERAMQAVPPALVENKEEHPVLANLFEGIALTEQGLNKAFAANGLVKFGEVGEAFDPNKHNALFEYPDSKLEPGTVGQVIKPGFMLSSRVLRPAEVGVVKKEQPKN